MSFIIQKGTWIWRTRWFPLVLQPSLSSWRKETHKLCGLKLLERQLFIEGFSISLPANSKVLIMFFWNKWKVFHWFKCRSYQKGTSLCKRPKQNYWTVWMFKKTIWKLKKSFKFSIWEKKWSFKSGWFCLLYGRPLELSDYNEKYLRSWQVQQLEASWEVSPDTSLKKYNSYRNYFFNKKLENSCKFKT